MKCPACGHENRVGAKFCEACASSLQPVCAKDPLPQEVAYRSQLGARRAQVHAVVARATAPPHADKLVPAISSPQIESTTSRSNDPRRLIPMRQKPVPQTHGGGKKRFRLRISSTNTCKSGYLDKWAGGIEPQ